MKNRMKALSVLLILLTMVSVGSAADIYFASASAGSNNGTSCANAYAYNDGTHGWSLSAQQVAGNTLHVCGTITVAAGANAMTFVNSGTSGNPITLFFESGSIIQSPNLANGYGGGVGGISANGKSYITINGNNTGQVQNTLTGSSGGTCPGGTCTFQTSGSNATTAISCVSCSHFILENLQIGPIDINVSPDVSQTPQQAQAVDVSGSNNTISGNNIHDGGWLVNLFYNNNDTNYVFSGNTLSNFVHGVALADGGSGNNCVAPCLFYEGNQLSAGSNWSVSGGGAGCSGNHINGLHLFGTAAGYMDGVYVANNYFSGTWGDCTDGFIYTDNNTSSPGVRGFDMENNVGIVTNTTITGGLTNGWFGIGGNTSPSGVQRVINNTLIGNSTTAGNNTFGWQLNGGMAALTFENNTSVGFGTPIATASGFTTPTAIDYNVYSAGGGGNGFVWHGAGVSGGSFSSWKTACSCDSHSIGTSTTSQYTSAGAPNSGAPTIEWGVNFGSIATGNLAFLANDTTLGGTRVAIARPSTGTCTSQGNLPCWDIGAYQYAAASQASPSTCTPASGVVPQTVTCTNPNSGTTVACYTTNGSTPATNGAGTGCTTGTAYTTSLSISVAETLKIIAGTSTLTDSTVNSYTYTSGTQSNAIFTLGIL